jgi:HKD family nuclease
MRSPSRLLLKNTGLGTTLEATITRELKTSAPKVIGVAVAYVSVYGANFLHKISSELGVSRIRLIADVGDAITHPEALRLALAHGWAVRAANPKAGTFHSKIMIGGDEFSDELGVKSPKWLIVGSGNLSRGGLVLNVETSFIRSYDEPSKVAGIAFRELWNVGTNLTAAILADYAIYFAKNNRKRSPKDMVILGVSDEDVEDIKDEEIKTRKVPAQNERSIATDVASAAWAGLESYTGEYTLQVEFPRDAGQVLVRIIGAAGAGPFVDLKCEDGEVRQMRFRYYDDNAMFRLNVPNDVPLAQWARDNKMGAALVECDDEGELNFRIVPPGNALKGIVSRSIAMGTWGRTPTRLYGWY